MSVTTYHMEAMLSGMKRLRRTVWFQFSKLICGHFLFLFFTLICYLMQVNFAEKEIVVSVFPNTMLKLHMARSWDFSGMHEKKNEEKEPPTRIRDMNL